MWPRINLYLLLVTSGASQAEHQRDMVNNDTINNYDRTQELKRLFDDSKIGVKGLVDSGVTSIPSFFRLPSQYPSEFKPIDSTNQDLIPTIDLARHRPSVVDEIRRAAAEFGFFQIVNHGVPDDLLDRTISAVRAFHEGSAESKAQFYTREPVTGVSFFSNVDLYKSQFATWRDTLSVRMGTAAADHDRIPSICREEVVEWDLEVERLGEVLLGLLSEGLGLNEGRLKDLSCLGSRVMVGHYYPYCPEPDQTMGLVSHTDPGVLTVLLQDQSGGLQIKYSGEWMNVKPLPGALVINVGDLLQIMSNDVYKSVDHRVVASNSKVARVSVAVFLNPNERDRPYGVLPDLVTPEKPARYKDLTMPDFMNRFFTKELDGHSLRGYFAIPQQMKDS